MGPAAAQWENRPKALGGGLCRSDVPIQKLSDGVPFGYLVYSAPSVACWAVFSKPLAIIWGRSRLVVVESIAIPNTIKRQWGGKGDEFGQARMPCALTLKFVRMGRL